MTLSVKMPGRIYEISDAYIMALTFIIVFSVTKILKEVIEKRKNKNKKEMKIQNPRGGGTEIQLSNDNELGFTILSCLADNEQYLVKNEKLKKMIFSLVKAKIENESLVLTPNMIRFLALKLISKDQTLIVKIGNVVLSSSNRVRLLTRVAGTAVIAFVGAVFSMLPYTILMALIFFDGTQNCGYNCDAHFQHLPSEAPVKIYAEQSAGHLVITENNDARQVEIYTPVKLPDEVSHTNTGQEIVKKPYKRSRKKARLVKFSEFQKTDPVLSKFKDLSEPEIPQQSCLINDVHDIIDIRID